MNPTTFPALVRKEYGRGWLALHMDIGIRGRSRICSEMNKVQ